MDTLQLAANNSTVQELAVIVQALLVIISGVLALIKKK